MSLFNRSGPKRVLRPAPQDEFTQAFNRRAFKRLDQVTEKIRRSQPAPPERR